MAALVSIVAILVIPLIFVAGLIVTGLNLGVLVAVVAVLGAVLTGGLSARAVWRRRKIAAGQYGLRPVTSSDPTVSETS